MNRLVKVSGPNVRACLATARRRLGVELHEAEEQTRSGGEDGLYRVTLTNGDVVECTIIQRSTCQT